MTAAEAIDRLYEVFRPKRKPHAIGACPCCQDQRHMDSLLTTPLRQITPDQLSRYGASVFLTVGGESDFRYLLPRILELTFREQRWWPSPEIALEKLALADWLSWSDEETQVLHDFFQTAFDDILDRRYGNAEEIDAWICGLGRAGVDVAPYLHKLEAPEVFPALIGFFELNAAALQEGKLGNSFWGNNRAPATPTQAAPIIAWFNSPKIQGMVWRHYDVN